MCKVSIPTLAPISSSKTDILVGINLPRESFE